MNNIYDIYINLIDTKAELYAMYLISVVVNIHLLYILIYIDTTNNSYINDKVGKNNLIDKCGYHYTQSIL